MNLEFEILRFALGTNQNILVVHWFGKTLLPLLRKFQGFVINTKVYENGVRQNSSTSSSEKSWLLNQSDLQIASKNTSPLLKPPFLQKDWSLHQGKSWEFSNPGAFGASLRSAINAMNLSCFWGEKNPEIIDFHKSIVTKCEQDIKYLSFASLVHPAKLRLNTQLQKSVKAPQKSKYNQVRTMHEATFTCSILTPGTQISVSHSSKDMWPSPFWSTFIEAFERVHRFWKSKNCTTQRKLYESMNPLEWTSKVWETKSSEKPRFG